MPWRRLEAHGLRREAATIRADATATYSKALERGRRAPADQALRDRAERIIGRPPTHRPQVVVERRAQATTWSARPSEASIEALRRALGWPPWTPTVAQVPSIPA